MVVIWQNEPTQVRAIVTDFALRVPRLAQKGRNEQEDWSPLLEHRDDFQDTSSSQIRGLDLALPPIPFANNVTADSLPRWRPVDTAPNTTTYRSRGAGLCRFSSRV